MCRLNDQELGVGLVLSPRVAVRMVFQCCETGQQVFKSVYPTTNSTPRERQSIPSFRYCFLISAVSAAGDISRSA